MDSREKQKEASSRSKGCADKNHHICDKFSYAYNLSSFVTLSVAWKNQIHIVCKHAWCWWPMYRYWSRLRSYKMFQQCFPKNEKKSYNRLLYLLFQHHRHATMPIDNCHFVFFGQGMRQWIRPMFLYIISILHANLLVIASSWYPFPTVLIP